MKFFLCPIVVILFLDGNTEQLNFSCMLSCIIYIKKQLFSTYISFLDLLHIIEKGGLTLSHLQINNLEGNIKSVSHTFRDLMDHVPDYFITKCLGFQDIKDLEQLWRIRVFNALRGVTIGVINNKEVPNIPERQRKKRHSELRGERDFKILVETYTLFSGSVHQKKFMI